MFLLYFYFIFLFFSGSRGIVFSFGIVCVIQWCPLNFSLSLSFSFFIIIIFFFPFYFEDDFGVSWRGEGTWFSCESPEFLQAIFLFQFSPSASDEGCFTSNAQLTRLRTVVGCSHFFSSFSSRIFCSLEKTRFSKSFNALGLLLRCEARRDSALF